MIFTNVSIREAFIIKDYIKHIDPNAFVTVIDANEIIGDGFKSFKDVGKMYWNVCFVKDVAQNKFVGTIQVV